MKRKDYEGNSKKTKEKRMMAPLSALIITTMLMLCTPSAARAGERYVVCHTHMTLLQTPILVPGPQNQQCFYCHAKKFFRLCNYPSMRDDREDGNRQEEPRNTQKKR